MMSQTGVECHGVVRVTYCFLFSYSLRVNTC